MAVLLLVSQVYHHGYPSHYLVLSSSHPTASQYYSNPSYSYDVALWISCDWIQLWLLVVSFMTLTTIFPFLSIKLLFLILLHFNFRIFFRWMQVGKIMRLLLLVKPPGLNFLVRLTFLHSRLPLKFYICLE